MTLGIPWDGDFYGVEASISIKDGIVGRFGVTSTQKQGNSNEYLVNGAGVQGNLPMIAFAAAVAYVAPYLLPALLSA